MVCFLVGAFILVHRWLSSCYAYTWEKNLLSCLFLKVEVFVTQLCPILCDPMDPLGSSVCGILQARVLEWVAIPFSRGSSQPRDRTRISGIEGRFLPSEPPGKPCVSFYEGANPIRGLYPNDLTTPLFQMPSCLGVRASPQQFQRNKRSVHRRLIVSLGGTHEATNLSSPQRSELCITL